MKRLPFRLRLTVWSILVVTVSLIVCGVVAAFVIRHGEMEELDEELQGESDHFFSELHRHGGAAFDWRTIDTEMAEWRPPVNPPRFLEVRTGGQVRWRSSNLGAANFSGFAPGFHFADLGRKRLRLRVTEDAGVTFAIAASTAEADGIVGDLVLALLAGMPVALAFAWLGGRRLAALAVAPVEEMTAATERITAEHLDQRVPIPAASDEIQRHARVLNATLDRLELSYRQALRFSADASHELKTPLTVLRASIEALLHSPTLDEHDRAAVSGLLEHTQRLTSITSGLLLLARADAGRLVLDVAEHDLSALTEACAEDARIVAEQRGVRVECALEPDAIAKIDALRLSQIVSNLLDNAVKYNCPGGEVRVTLAAAGPAWRLTVANTGEGIPPEFQPRLFERFFRGERVGEGSQGLGLGLARELAHAHGGEVALVRSDGAWTEFALTLPREIPPLIQTKKPSDMKPSDMKPSDIKSAASILLALLTSAILARADDAAVAAKLAKLPPAAAAALKLAAGTGKIESVTTEKEGKTTIYEIDFTESGKPNREYSVTADGKMNAEEEAIPLEKVPEGARKAIEENTKGAKIERINRIKRAGGQVTYEPLYVNSKGKKTEMEFLADGSLKPEAK